MRRQKDILRGDGAYNPNRKKEHAALKKALQKTSFSLGTDVRDLLSIRSATTA